MKKTKFKIYVSQYKDLVYSQAYFFTKSEDDAKDITQEVLIKLWNHLDNVPAQAAKSWLLQVTTNLCIDFSRRKRELSASALAVNLQRDGISVEQEDCRPNPEQEMINLDAKEKLLHAIYQLPEKVRLVIIMREIEDLKYDDIAKALEMPINSVKAYLFRGRKLLFEKLKPFFADA